MLNGSKAVKGPMRISDKRVPLAGRGDNLVMKKAYIPLPRHWPERTVRLWHLACVWVPLVDSESSECPEGPNWPIPPLYDVTAISVQPGMQQKQYNTLHCTYVVMVTVIDDVNHLQDAEGQRFTGSQSVVYIQCLHGYRNSSLSCKIPQNINVFCSSQEVVKLTWDVPPLQIHSV